MGGVSGAASSRRMHTLSHTRSRTRVLTRVLAHTLGRSALDQQARAANSALQKMDTKRVELGNSLVEMESEGDTVRDKLESVRACGATAVAPPRQRHHHPRQLGTARQHGQLRQRPPHHAP